jgi:uncharacterized membrane protein SpoIIM required for sporulation
MLESLLSFKEVNDKPYLMAVWSFIICCIAVLISSQIPLAIPGTNSGFLVVLFTIVPSVYFITALIKREEELEESYINKHYMNRFWARHEKDVMMLLFFFLGLTLAFSVWSLALSQNFFSAQVDKINEIQGLSVSIVGKATELDTFVKIFNNNMQVLFFSFLFSFIFGAGAIFIIAWNASVLGVYIGQLSKHIWQIPIISLSFLPHGLPEIAGYLAAGLAGGLLSAAIIRKNTSKVLRIVSLDCLKIMVIAVLLILGGAGIEAYLS